MPAFSPTCILRVASHHGSQLTERIRTLASTPPSWTSTLSLPKSQFPARPSPEQLEIYRKRCADELYDWQRCERLGLKKVGQEEFDNEFVLHDGPPYANGAVHVGHALNKVLKDLVVRWELSRGKRVRYVPGWDCHGLPIELKALQQPKVPIRNVKPAKDAPAREAQDATDAANRMTAPEIRAAARELASSTIEAQKTSFRQWGVMGEWHTPYKTMSKDFEIKQLGIFREMVRKGLISRNHRPVYWSPSSQTALAEAELEYDDDHTCTAAFVKMPFIRIPKALHGHPSVRSDNISALVWTTTPWTLPANKAIAIKRNIEYSVIEIISDSEHDYGADQLMVGRERVDYILSSLDGKCSAKIVIDSILGSELLDGNPACYNLFTASESPLLEADFVTATSGTGLVHMAPGHGMEDYQVCQANGVGPALAPVDDKGSFTAEAFPVGEATHHFSGLDVQTAGVKAVLRVLSDPGKYLPEHFKVDGKLLLSAHKFVHKNPIDWRTKQPVIVRATAQWFADVSAIKERALIALDDVRFVPESGKKRLQNFITGRSQWCISRQRTWGVPIPALYHLETGDACITDESICHIISVIEQRGVDAWFSDAPDDSTWLHPDLEPGKWIRGRDTMDVWFDSGTTWTSLDKRHLNSALSDVYLEGTDQHRGWFQSSLLTAIATQDVDSKPIAPFKTLATHGFTLDGGGRKMSKSLGNVISPDEILSGSLLPTFKNKNKGKGQQQSQPPMSKKAQQGAMGPDLLRLWVASSDYTRDVSISEAVLRSTQQALQKYRVTFKFLLGVLHDYPAPLPQADLLSKLSFADEAVLWQLSKCSKAVYEAYTDYAFYSGIIELNRFVNNDLSAFYFEVIKDTLYAGQPQQRRHIQTVLVYILREMLRMLAPATPHLVEEVWEWMPRQMKGEGEQPDPDLHPLRQVWDVPFFFPAPPDIDAMLEAFRRLSSAVKVAQEQVRNKGLLGSGLACRVVVSLNVPPKLEDSLREISWLRGKELPNLLVVSQAELVFKSATQQSSNHNDQEEPLEVSEWRYEQPVNFEWSGQTISGTVTVLPPQGQKCVRCWKYTAEEKDFPCSQCQTVLAESL